MKYLTGIMLALLISTASCGKNDNAPPAKVAPSNLTINAVVATDSSGTVSFSATAQNAVSYDFDFGNGKTKTVTNGTVKYTYSGSGEQNFTVKVTAKSADGLTVSQSTSVKVSISKLLVWSDEFTEDGAPDSNKWGYDIGTGDNGWGNNEAQYYTDRAQNVIVSDGTLKITAMKENYQGKSYTSARLLTRGKFEFTYGKVEVSAKLPSGVGVWPAIWMLGSSVNTIGWPACGEIDIMEHKGVEPQKLYSTLHYPNHSGGNGVGSTTNVSNMSNSFHKYTLDWTPTALKFYVDDQLFFTFNNTASLPFNDKFFILLNFAMGGNFGGSIDPAFNKSTFEVDYVRVYKN
ncbi:beta-glucanase precursor [Chitinophaga silvatica]|uniref:Beta-glucanase n=1 Tax=Chitinophaga silvatica TaxID=2282649 RepID=A0A3E1YEJ7_9BACT|nr:family 16 glycosylhydrolase [Chitinophaga silvatica]RFS24717.1 beta-glucanase precursor [Chitinophaga silvatica]